MASIQPSLVHADHFWDETVEAKVSSIFFLSLSLSHHFSLSFCFSNKQTESILKLKKNGLLSMKVFQICFSNNYAE